MEIEVSLVALVVLFLLDLSIAAARVSLLNARPLRLLALREHAPTAVDRTLTLIEHPRLRATMRLSQTLTRFSLVGMVLLLVDGLFGSRNSLLGIQAVGLLLLGLLLLVCEFAVEGKILQDAEHWALRLLGFARFLVLLFTPLVFLPLRLLHSQGTQPTASQVTEDELKSWVEGDGETGGLEREERQMIYSIFQFGDTLAREIMVPRIDVLALEVTTPLSQAVKAFIQSGHSRLPVFEESIDNIVGLLYAKDLLRTMNGEKKKVEMRELLRPAYFVPETKKVDELLTEMQSQRIHMAVVVDEYGGMAGLVTLEDIVEEIIGEIRDEYDVGEELLYQPVGGGEYIFQGRIALDDFNQVMDSHLPKDEADTLAGFLYDRMGRVPQGGETLQVDGLLLTVEQVAGRRIRRVRVRRVDEKQGEEQDAKPN
jgi:putative hemolysin